MIKQQHSLNTDKQIALSTFLKFGLSSLPYPPPFYLSTTQLPLQFRREDHQNDYVAYRRLRWAVGPSCDILELFLRIESSGNKKKKVAIRLAYPCKERPLERGPPEHGSHRVHQQKRWCNITKWQRLLVLCLSVPLFRFPLSTVSQRAILTIRMPSYISTELYGFWSISSIQ